MAGSGGTGPVRDSLRVAAIIGAVAGALAVPLPFFTGLTEAMAGLGVAAVAMVIAGDRRDGRVVRARWLVAGLVVAAAGWITFAWAPSGIGPIRALVLGLTSAPLGWFGSKAPPGGMP